MDRTIRDFAEKLAGADEKQRAEWLARTEELKKALEEVRLAQEAAASAETQRLAVTKAAEKATMAPRSR
jgi:hypothetical protein